MQNLGVLRWFDCGHLPAHLQKIVAPFRAIAESIVRELSGAEALKALDRLLEAKDAAVRAAIETAERRALAEKNYIEPKEG